jgi:Protein of unknown function (DUF3300)
MILMSSTYPLEIVEAYRWVQKNPKLTGKALEDALKQNEWDPSVKAMCGFPTVLKQMSDNLDWTQDLGDAFLGQEKEVMDTIQKMRRKAMDAGTLKSNEQMKVTDSEKVIVIESTKTDTVYVPTYSPTVVYGSAWSYPTYYYPPMYVAPPPGQAFFAFSVGVVWGAAIWGNCNWGGGNCNINVNNFNNFNRNTSINPQNRQGGAGGRDNFKHDPSHRKGANYKNPQTAQKFGGAGGSNRVSKDQARGFDRGGSKAGPSAGTRPSGGAAGAGGRGGAGAGAGGGARPSTRPSTGAGGGGRSSGALSGSRSPGADRSASSRGAASRGGGGGSRGGGGRGGGGRGGGRR